MNAHRLCTALLFTGEQCGRAEEAIGLYLSLFDDVLMLQLERYEAGDGGGERAPPGSVAYWL